MVRVILAAVILNLLGAGILAAPVNKDEDVQIKVVSESNNYKMDDFEWSYVLSDGQEVRQNAYTKQADYGTKVLVFNGFYSYGAPDGVKYSVIYYADENGYHPTVIVGDDPRISTPSPPKLYTELLGEAHYQPAEPTEKSIDPNVLKSLIGG